MEFSGGEHIGIPIFRLGFRYKHVNIVELLGYSCDGPHKCLVYEFMVNGSLLDRLACKVRNSVGYQYLFQVSILFDTSFRYQIQVSILFNT